MGEKEFVKLCRKCVADYYGWKKYTADDIYVVWLNKTIQNNKAMLSTTKSDGMYFEITYNGDKQELYFDAYKQIDRDGKKIRDDYSSTLSKLLAKIRNDYPNVNLLYGKCKDRSLLVIKDFIFNDHELYDFKKHEYSAKGLTQFLNAYGGKAYDDLNDLISELSGMNLMDNNYMNLMDNNYWYEFTCTNCKKKFRALQKDADDVIQCPFCKTRPWGFNVSGTKKKGLTVDEFIDQAEKFLEEDILRDMRQIGFDYEYINLWNDEVEAAADGTIKGKFEASSPDDKPIGDYIVSYNIVDGSWNIHTITVE